MSLLSPDSAQQDYQAQDGDFQSSLRPGPSHAMPPVVTGEEEDKPKQHHQQQQQQQQQEEAPTRGRSKSHEPGPRRKRRMSSMGSRSKNEVDVFPVNSPTQVYRNLLTLEGSLREQYMEHIISRRKHIWFFSALLSATVYFSYTVFLEPSIYRLFSFIQRVGFVATFICLGLFYLTGLYHKTFVETPKFIHTANKGMRAFNIKVVKIAPTWKESCVALVWNPVYSSRPGGLIKVVMTPRAFNSETVEGWEVYRQEYWEREHERLIRRKKQQQATQAGAGAGAGAGSRRKRSLSKTVQVK